MNSKVFLKSLLVFMMISLTGCFIVPANNQLRNQCENINIEEEGFKDGQDGSRDGDRFETWQWHCRRLRISFDRQKYKDGYDRGLKHYCSCEKGFIAGVKDEFAELQGQYYTCDREQKKAFYWAHEQGGTFKTDVELVQKPTPVRTVFNEEKILDKAKSICASKPENAEAKVKPVGDELKTVK